MPEQNLVGNVLLKGNKMKVSIKELEFLDIAVLDYIDKKIEFRDRYKKDSSMYESYANDIDCLENLHTKICEEYKNRMNEEK